MKTFKIAFFFLLSSSVIFSKEDQPIDLEKKEIESKANSDLYMAEFSAAYFYPVGKEFRSFYDGGVIWGLEFDYKVHKYLYVWNEADFFSKKGKDCLGKTLKLLVVPLSVGLKWVYPESGWRPYLGVGLEASYFSEKTKDRCLIHSLHMWDLGVRFKSGMLFLFKELYFVNLFADYSLRKVLHRTEHDSVVLKNPNVDNCSFGGAFGVSF
jgi:hypothetical protein